jgi:transposase
MQEIITSYVGLDIHKDSIAMAVAEAGRGAPRFIGSTPAHITRKASEKLIKTDRLDALLLARESRAGNLVRVIVPDERDEAIRDLARAREDAVAARLRARLQIKAMLLRHGRAYQGKSSWTQAHERHLAAIKFELPAQQIAFDEYRLAVKDAHERVERLTQALGEQCEHWRMRGVVKALMCLRGLDLVAATIFIAEIGDLSRFAHPSRPIEIRQQGQPKAIRDIAWKAQLRLAYRFRKLNAGRKMTQNKCCVAVARELAAFIWDIGRQVKIPA